MNRMFYILNANHVEVWVVCISNKNGNTYSTHRHHDDAFQEVYYYALQKWRTEYDGELPNDAEEVVQQYFTNGGNDWYEIEECNL